MQEELGRLAHRTDEQEEGDQLDRVEFHAGKGQHRLGMIRDMAEDNVEIHRPENMEQRHDTQGKAEITDTVGDKGLDGGVVGGLLLVPETDEQIGGQAHTFPAEEELEEVVGGHQHQHGEGEERQIGEETRAVRIVGHVAPGIDMHERGDRVDDDQHGRGQRIQLDVPGDIEIANTHPRRQLDGLGVPAHCDVKEEIPGQRCGEHDKKGRDDLRDAMPDDIAEQAGDNGRQERSEDNDVGCHVS